MDEREGIKVKNDFWFLSFPPRASWTSKVYHEKEMKYMPQYKQSYVRDKWDLIKCLIFDPWTECPEAQYLKKIIV